MHLYRVLATRVAGAGCGRSAISRNPTGAPASRPRSEPDPSDTFVGLHEAGAWIGICELDPTTGWIDGPGVIPGLRTPDRYARLVRGAAALVQSSPVGLETWGDSEETIESYRQLGFKLLEYVPGWELIL